MAGIYIHVPFCASKCSYCDFASYPKEISKQEAYFACLYREMKGRAQELKGKRFDTVYFGGGTPSFVDAKYILGTMRLIRQCYNLSEDAEVTLEVNPGTIDRNKLRLYKMAGINRFSIGMQSADDKMLARLGRIHTSGDFLAACKILKGYNLSADIMIGLFDQTKEDVKRSIDLAIEGGVNHISCYALTPEVGTPIYTNYLNGELLSADETADLYDYARAYLKEKGFMRYEVSNFAKVGFESRHNLNYWKRGEYIGLGVAAASFIGERRFDNTSSIDEYVHCILNGVYAEKNSDKIESDDRKFEYVMLALRTVYGVNLKDYEKAFGTNFLKDYEKQLEKQAKYLQVDGDRVYIKDEYLYVQNNVIIDFMG